jgi:hypothetical protein
LRRDRGRQQRRGRRRSRQQRAAIDPARKQMSSRRVAIRVLVCRAHVIALCHLCVISLRLHERAVVVAGAEIDLDLPDLISGEPEEFRVAEFVPVIGDALIEHERFAPLLEDLLKQMGPYALAVRPAPFEIDRLADRIVVRLVKVKSSVNSASTVARSFDL